ncbi:cyclin-domain-containing protein [Plenodomus tracheiphilus IPT5]|uniref:Cyclin-domain-containing protein n=1 Tax=Plenodomus tracheiphilus IPT5 TaxID=1408161 RepID=A0A6A7BGU8_9PLEO|nr:cyclin-domain-containing protein [Plenodomus tracheiphilus IPT5]
MGSILVSDFGGNHFNKTMFGAGSAHPLPHESPAVHQHHPSLRPSPSTKAHAPHPHAVAPAAGTADVPMADSGAPPSSATPAQRPQHLPAESPQHTLPTPSSPRFRPQSQHSTPAPRPATSHTAIPTAIPTAASTEPPAPPLRSPAPSTPASPRRIKVKSLSHIQSFAIDDASPFSQTRSQTRRQRQDPADVAPQYEISEMPVTDIIEMVAGLLTKITTTNDRQHDHLHRQIPPPEGASGLSQQTTSVLAFHGKNVPSISILSYLSRIHKYCPTTYEVFLSLLVYFDRMTERPLEHLNPASSAASGPTTTTLSPSAGAQAATPPPSGSLGKPEETPTHRPQPPSPPLHELDSDAYNVSHYFVVDSFNIHRLVIAGVTCASKFFSDVFYTNSRYAKVGGLPLVELNHLELQFLLLNDFRLAVPLEEMEAYGTMLVEFYAREVAEQHERQSGGSTKWE